MGERRNLPDKIRTNERKIYCVGSPAHCKVQETQLNNYIHGQVKTAYQSCHFYTRVSVDRNSLVRRVHSRNQRVWRMLLCLADDLLLILVLPVLPEVSPGLLCLAAVWLLICIVGFVDGMFAFADLDAFAELDARWVGSGSWPGMLAIDDGLGEVSSAIGSTSDIKVSVFCPWVPSSTLGSQSIYVFTQHSV